MDIKIIIKLDTFFDQYPQQTFEKGAILIRSGDEPKGIFYLKKGNVRQYTINTNGEEITLTIYKPHTFFPMAWAVDAYSITHYFEAMDESNISIAPKADVVAFIKKEPDVMFDLLIRLYRGMDGILSRLEFLMYGSARQKLVSILLISAKRFGDIDKSKVLLNLKISHQDLAHLAGLSRETVSREMMVLKKKKLIDYTNTSITIHIIKNLEKELVE